MRSRKPATPPRFSGEALAAAVEDGAQIVFTGGGNFGDLWPATHELRERVLQDFKGVRMVQLQQTVHFRRADNLARTSGPSSASTSNESNGTGTWRFSSETS